MIALVLASCLALPAVQAQAAHESPAQAPVPSGGCASSCTMDAAPAPPLTRDEFEGLLETWSTQALDEPTLALETLLFHGPETRAWLHAVGTGPLDAAHAAFLDRELDRDTVVVEMKMLDDRGRERGHALASGVGLATKQHLTFTGTGSLGHLESGGKVKRVGLDHLWSRW